MLAMIDLSGTVITAEAESVLDATNTRAIRLVLRDADRDSEVTIYVRPEDGRTIRDALLGVE